MSFFFKLMSAVASRRRCLAVGGHMRVEYPYIEICAAHAAVPEVLGFDI